MCAIFQCPHGLINLHRGEEEIVMAALEMFLKELGRMEVEKKDFNQNISLYERDGKKP